MSQVGAVEFFYDNAGYSYDPATETVEDGRLRGARQLAMAERFAQVMGAEYVWEDDWSLGGNHADNYCADAYPDNGGEPETCEWVAMYAHIPAGFENMALVASLSCIDDATPEYRRVIEAELALEWLSTGGKA